MMPAHLIKAAIADNRRLDFRRRGKFFIKQRLFAQNSANSQADAQGMPMACCAPDCASLWHQNCRHE